MSIDHRSFHRLILGLVGLAWFLMTAPPAAAEWFADLYGGAAGTERSDVTLVVNPPSGPANHTFHNVKWDISATVGGRAAIGLRGFRGTALGWTCFISMQTFRHRQSLSLSQAQLYQRHFRRSIFPSPRSRSMSSDCASRSGSVQNFRKGSCNRT